MDAISSAVSSRVKTYPGFTSPSSQTDTIKPDGSLIITYDYDRENRTLTLVDKDSIDLENSSSEGSYPYETEDCCKNTFNY